MSIVDEDRGPNIANYVNSIASSRPNLKELHAIPQLVTTVAKLDAASLREDSVTKLVSFVILH